jgi:hypothetical protein
MAKTPKESLIISQLKSIYMPEFSAAIFATNERPFGQEHSLQAHALLFEGSRPYWEVYIGGKTFRFIPNPDFILEDGLWQLNNYCQIQESEYKFDINDNMPLTLEEEFGVDICKQYRTNISKELSITGFHFKLIQWPGFWINKWNDKIKQWQSDGVLITN